MFRIYRETPADWHEVENLYDTAFAPGRTALSSYRLRDGVDPVAELCLLMRDEYDAVAGAIRYWPIRIAPPPGAEEDGRGAGAAGDADAAAEGAAAGDADPPAARPAPPPPVPDAPGPGVPALLLGPVAVHPTRHGEGLGGLLMMESLDRAREAGWTRVVLVGDEPYYRRFGFRRDLALGVEFPPPTNPDRILARELQDGAMDGVAGLVQRWG
ncbi:GNAT family N-acetyltransferase [Rhodovulum sp. DZ06]|uniref:GNAT family N-acetyltransferase n=1 Tax=Rhodovulum sp. DZ06 TaxID=3425126 RepID=UPI003D335FD3